ncbi:hypothetical protein CORC01_14214 [Colletotrichum orchidophilum]|uniref:C2H2-type domain-containing protein n=1 Tax=Colletotrichum orchidophilum TaxID=1209926 RepID=A0A1G4AN09_9PEZI|nr:uncharacterized protein CORC01_14214 [Colletotrichum orchidophilum]OHE90486.1 hypothetical protein CORC01_14214 [Colletotrichum orchidophilum]
MPNNQAQFIHVNPGKAKRTPKDTQLQCQVCFKAFDTREALRDHIGAFQVNKSACYENESDDDDDDNDDDEDDDDEDDDDEDDEYDHSNDGHGAKSCQSGLEQDGQAKLRCPYTNCSRKKHFKARRGLVRHYQSQRHAQLRRHSAEQLSQMLPMDGRRRELGAKRKHEEVDEYSEPQLPKKRAISNNNGRGAHYRTTPTADAACIILPVRNSSELIRR